MRDCFASQNFPSRRSMLRSFSVGGLCVEKTKLPRGIHSLCECSFQQLVAGLFCFAKLPFTGNNQTKKHPFCDGGILWLRKSSQQQLRSVGFNREAVVPFTALLRTTKGNTSHYFKKEASFFFEARSYFHSFVVHCTLGGNRTHTPERTGF